MRNHKRLIGLLLTLCMVLSLVPAVSAEETKPLATEDEVVIYYTNDVHTYIDGDISYDNIAALKQATAEITDVLLVDAGDHIQGTAYGSMDKGETIIDLMNAAGYDLATLGNHEFDYTMEGAMNTIDRAEFPYVSCNFYHEKDGVKGETVLDAYKVFTLGEHKVAIIGMTTPETFTKSTPAYFQDGNGNYIYGIAGGTDGKDLYAAVQAAIDAASREADIVIGLAHLGDDPASKPWTSEEVIANTTGLDAVIDGHSHSTVPMKEIKDKAGNTVVLTQTGEYFNAIGRMSIDTEGKITTSLIDEYAESDADVKAIKDAWMAEVDEQLGEVIGYADVTFDNYNGESRLVRSMETNTGDFAADALYYLFDNMGLDVDVAIMNGGGVRNKAITGNITYKICKDIHTFGNVACLQTVTGQQILDALEWGARGTPNEEIGGFLHVSGLTYDINTSIKSTVQMDDKGVWTGGPTGEYRVQNVKILQDGKWVDLDLEAEYNLAGYNYTLRDLGDGFAMFDGAVNVLDYVMEDYMVLANYVQSFPKGENGLPTITADNSPYGNLYGEGRINLCTFPDVASGYWGYPYIELMAALGVVEGYENGEFRPENDLTRAEFATMLYRALVDGEVSSDNPYSDLKKNEGSEWYYDAVLALSELGVIEGYEDGTFRAANKITRQEMVTMVYRFQKVLEEQQELEIEYTPNDLKQFTDAEKVADWALEAMQWTVGTGIVNGMTETTLVPTANTNRAQVCKVLSIWLLDVAKDLIG